MRLIPLTQGQTANSSKCVINFCFDFLAAIGLEVSHSRFNIRVSHPMLTSPQINASPQMPCTECRPELVQVKILKILVSRPFCHGFAAVEKVEFRIAARSREDQPTGLVGFCLPCLQSLHQFVGDRNFPLLIRLRSPTTVRLVCHPHDRMIEMDV